MSNDNEIQIRLLANASGVRPGIEMAKSDVPGLRDAIWSKCAQFSAMGGSMNSATVPRTAATAEMATEMKVLISETEGESLSLWGMASAAKEAGEAQLGVRHTLFCNRWGSSLSAS